MIPAGTVWLSQASPGQQKGRFRRPFLAVIPLSFPRIRRSPGRGRSGSSEAAISPSFAPQRSRSRRFSPAPSHRPCHSHCHCRCSRSLRPCPRFLRRYSGYSPGSRRFRCRSRFRRCGPSHCRCRRSRTDSSTLTVKRDNSYQIQPLIRLLYCMRDPTGRFQGISKGSCPSPG